MRIRPWLAGMGWVFLAAVWLVVIAASWADAADDYNFNWLDPDKKIYVLQNRRYLKAEHLLLSAGGGFASTSPYRNTYSIDGKMAYYVTEAFGFEVFYSQFLNAESNLLAALKENSPNALPFVREIKAQYGGLLHWAPWYAKINFFNQIIYFDWFFSGGAGTISAALDKRSSTKAAANLVDEKLFALYLGTGHQYHLSQKMVVRLDVLGSFYQGTYINNSSDKTWFSNLNFGIGLGYRL